MVVINVVVIIGRVVRIESIVIIGIIVITGIIVKLAAMAIIVVAVMKRQLDLLDLWSQG